MRVHHGHEASSFPHLGPLVCFTCNPKNDECFSQIGKDRVEQDAEADPRFVAVIALAILLEGQTAEHLWEEGLSWQEEHQNVNYKDAYY